jgi:hypothetical protein
MPKLVDVRRWVHLLASISDRALAVRFVRSELAEMEPHDAAALLSTLSAATDARDAQASDAMLLCSMALAQAPELRANIARAALVLGDAMTARRLLGAPSGEREEGVEGHNAALDARAGRALSLGERKSLARGRDRQLLARVLRDPHPDVVRILLGNPYLTAVDVVRLCARRPCSPEVLREVFRSPRWMTRPEVRLALIKNPSLPIDLALSLVPHLRANEAREVGAAFDLPASLREASLRRAHAQRPAPN